MKLTQTLTVVACAAALWLGTSGALAQSCCVTAKAKGKDCENKCCVAAHADHKTCDKCQADATCCDKAIAAGKACEHECCVAAAKGKRVCEKCNPKKEEKKS